MLQPVVEFETSSRPNELFLEQEDGVDTKGGLVVAVFQASVDASGVVPVPADFRADDQISRATMIPTEC